MNTGRNTPRTQVSEADTVILSDNQASLFDGFLNPRNESEVSGG
jgi:hypothetical protein